jgi:hypothetical protein
MLVKVWGLLVRAFSSGYGCGIWVLYERCEWCLEVAKIEDVVLHMLKHDCCDVWMPDAKRP